MAKRINVFKSQSLPFLVSVLRAAGLDADEVIARHGLPADVEHCTEVRVPLSTLQKLGDEVADRLQAPFIGAIVASNIPRGRMGLFEFILRNARNLLDGLRLGIRYIRLLNELVEVRVTEGKDEIRFDHWIAGEPLCLGRQSNEFVLVAVVRYMRELTGTEIKFEKVWFVHGRREDPAPLMQALGSKEILFGQPTNGFTLSAADSVLPLVGADLALLSVLEQQAQAALARSTPVNDGLRSVREQIRVCLQNGAPRIETIAAALAMSPRTLQRRLTEDGTSFAEVVDEVRATLSEVYLADPSVGLSQIAVLLGYSDQRAFTRAFNRWHGMSPGRYRETRL